MSATRTPRRGTVLPSLAQARLQRSSDLFPMRTWLARVLARFGAPGAARGRLTILMYHRVLAEADPMRPHDITARTFDEQMNALARVFNVLPMNEALARLAAGTLPERTVCITFDDGYRDNVAIALPILQRLALPATFYVTTGVLGDGRMFNDTVIEALRDAPSGTLDLTWLGLPPAHLSDAASRAAAALRVIAHLKYVTLPMRDEICARMTRLTRHRLPDDLMMTPEQVTQLARTGMEIGGHTTDHVMLTAVSLDEARRQIEDNRRDLAALTGMPPDHFAYPNGRPGTDFGDEHTRIVREAGYRTAVTTAWGQVMREDDVFLLSRCGTFDVGPGRFAVRLLLHGRAQGRRSPAAD